MQPNETTGTACADCGAVFPIPPASGFASGYAITAVPRLPSPQWRYLKDDGGSCLSAIETPQIPCYPAVYNVEGEQAAHDAKRELPFRRICYACSATLERETLTANGRGCLYLTTKPADQRLGTLDRSYVRQTASGPYHYRYELSGWPGVPTFSLVGRVKESHGYGFGRRYPVQTFRFIGPDGFVWSGRCAGDMELARCKRTKERHKGGAR